MIALSSLQAVLIRTTRMLIVLAVVLSFAGRIAVADDLSSTYQWKPVRIGGGGWVVGMVLHPLDSTVRYARTDVGNAYRWDVPTQQWIPMRVSNPDGSGIRSASATGAPSGYGVDAIAVDPTNTSIVYLVFTTAQSCDVQCPTGFVEIYKSIDGGQNFTPGHMTASAINGNANGTHRWAGERLSVDPANPAVLYYGSESQGLYRSTNGGTTWTQLSGTSNPPANIEFISTQLAKTPGTVTANGIVVSKVLYAVSINNSDAGGDVYQSSDGGQTWTDISTGVTDAASGQSLKHQALSSSIDTSDALYVAENSATDGSLRAYWRFAAGNWTRFSLQSNGINSINQSVVSVVADPTNLQRIYALGADTSLARSDYAGQSWINLGPALYANTLGWLPQTVGMAGGQWHSNGGLKIDASGNLWTPTGQEGPLTIAASAASTATSANPPKWSIVTTGIEEMVSDDIVIPPAVATPSWPPRWTQPASSFPTQTTSAPSRSRCSRRSFPRAHPWITHLTSRASSPSAPATCTPTVPTTPATPPTAAKPGNASPLCPNTPAAAVSATSPPALSPSARAAREPLAAITLCFIRPRALHRSTRRMEAQPGMSRSPFR